MNETTKKKERNNRIQRENDILIRRILDVDKKHQKLRKSEFYLDSKHMKLRSLNRRTRDAKLRRVTRDNEKILDRILNVRPQLDRTKWKLEEKQRQKILRMNCYKFAPNNGIFAERPSAAQNATQRR